MVKVVEVAERIRVEKPKNQGFAKKCHRSQMPIQIPLGNRAPSCRSFNLQARLSRFLASDQRYISARPRRLADMFGLALELLDGTLRRSEFLSELLEHLHNFPRRLIYTKHHAHTSSECGAVFAAHMHPEI